MEEREKWGEDVEGEVGGEGEGEWERGGSEEWEGEVRER